VPCACVICRATKKAKTKEAQLIPRIDTIAELLFENVAYDNVRPISASEVLPDPLFIILSCTIGLVFVRYNPQMGGESNRANIGSARKLWETRAAFRFQAFRPW